MDKKGIYIFSLLFTFGSDIVKRLFNTAAAKLAFHFFDMSSDMFTLSTLLVLFKLLYTVETVACMPIRVANVARSREGPSPRSLDSYENFKPLHYICYLVAILRFPAIYVLFRRL